MWYTSIGHMISRRRHSSNKRTQFTVVRFFFFWNVVYVSILPISLHREFGSCFTVVAVIVIVVNIVFTIGAFILFTEQRKILYSHCQFIASVQNYCTYTQSEQKAVLNLVPKSICAEKNINITTFPHFEHTEITSSGIKSKFITRTSVGCFAQFHCK